MKICHHEQFIGGQRDIAGETTSYAFIFNIVLRCNSDYYENEQKVNLLSYK